MPALKPEQFNVIIQDASNQLGAPGRPAAMGACAGAVMRLCSTLVHAASAGLASPCHGSARVAGPHPAGLAGLQALFAPVEAEDSGAHRELQASLQAHLATALLQGAPQLSGGAAALLQQYYVTLRQSLVPVGQADMLATLIRLATACARLCHRCAAAAAALAPPSAAGLQPCRQVGGGGVESKGAAMRRGVLAACRGALTPRDGHGCCLPPALHSPPARSCSRAAAGGRCWRAPTAPRRCC
jgi:hypothetical protein